MEDFLIFTAVGFCAQLIDGALGMAYGLTATTAWLTLDVPPAHASAATHAAEIFTTAASAGSHLKNKNVDWPLFWKLTPAGMAGGVIGAYVLTGINGKALTPYIFAYLGLMGIFILYRSFKPVQADGLPKAAVAPLGAVGGFVDAVGDGGWGPVVTTTLVGAGEQPRYVIGTVNTAEFFVTVATSVGFLTALLTGRWEEAGDITKHASAVAGLVVGGILAAPLAGYAVRQISQHRLGRIVGILVLGLSAYQIARVMY